jgi:hypothetical protein
MKVEISDGELLDKLSILKIKEKFIVDESKLKNVDNEINALSPLCTNLLYGLEISDLYQKLILVNTKLWEIEDQLRIKEKSKEFDDEFISLARSVYYTNDERASIKKEINKISGSFLTEEKSYQDYK